MSRIRTIKPEFFRHADLYDAEVADALPLRLAFAGLWCVADREGRFKWRPRELKIEVLPHDNVDFSRVLDALTTRGFVVKYRVDGVDYGWIPSFTRHQVINNREKASDLPAPNENNALTRAPREDDACATREARGESGKEGKGKEGEPTLSAVDSEGDVQTVVFNNGVAYLSRTTRRSEQSCRGIVGKWVKTHGIEATITVLSAAQRQGAVEPIAWIEAAFRERSPPKSARAEFN